MFYTGFDMTRRFPHLTVASVRLAKHDEKEEVPPHRVCYIPHPRNTRRPQPSPETRHRTG